MAKAAAGHATGAALRPLKNGPRTSAANGGNVTMIRCKAAIKWPVETGHSKLDESAG